MVLEEYDVREYGSGVVRLDLNESPFPPPKEVVERSCREGERLNRYPERSMYAMIYDSLSDYVGVDKSLLALSSGGDHAIFTVMSLLAGDRGGAAVPMYTYGMAKTMLKGLGFRVFEIPMLDSSDRWVLDVDELFGAARKHRILFIDSPNNPTGSPLISRRLLRELASEARGYVIVDEAYAEFSRETLAGIVEEMGNVVLVRTMSKALSLAGLRIGYIIAEKRLARAFRAVAPYPMGRMQLVIASGLLENRSFIKNVVNYVVSERERMFSELKSMGARPFRSEANFLLVDTCFDRAVQKLLEKGIAVRGVPIKGSMIRVTVGLKRDNDAFLRAVNNIIQPC